MPDTGSDGDTLDPAPLDTTEPPVVTGVQHRGLPPGQRLHLSVQHGLGALDGEHVVRPATSEIVGVATLGM